MLAARDLGEEPDPLARAGYAPSIGSGSGSSTPTNFGSPFFDLPRKKERQQWVPILILSVFFLFEFGFGSWILKTAASPC